MEEKTRRNEGWVEDKEVILIKPYEVSSLTFISTHSTSFIDKEIENLIKYIKFIKAPTQTRLFHPPSHYQSLKSQGEQDPEFWKEITMVSSSQMVDLVFLYFNFHFNFHSVLFSIFYF